MLSCTYLQGYCRLTYLFAAEVPFPPARHRAGRVGFMLGRGAAGAACGVFRLLRVHHPLHLAGRVSKDSSLVDAAEA